MPLDTFLEAVRVIGRASQILEFPCQYAQFAAHLQCVHAEDGVDTARDRPDRVGGVNLDAAYYPVYEIAEFVFERILVQAGVQILTVPEG